jgi:hypothetical protein
VHRGRSRRSPPGQVAALAAEADAPFTSAIAAASAPAPVLGHAQEVEGELPRRALADAGQARQLRDEVVH